MSISIDIADYVHKPYLVLVGNEAEGFGISHLQEIPSDHPSKVTSRENIKALKKKLNLLASVHGPSTFVLCFLWSLILISIVGFFLVFYMSWSFLYLIFPAAVYIFIPSTIRAYRRSLSSQVYLAWERELPQINFEAQKDGFIVLIFREEHSGIYHGLYSYRVYVAETIIPLPPYRPSELQIPPPVYLTIQR